MRIQEEMGRLMGDPKADLESRVCNIRSRGYKTRYLQRNNQRNGPVGPTGGGGGGAAGRAAAAGSRDSVAGDAGAGAASAGGVAAAGRTARPRAARGRTARAASSDSDEDTEDEDEAGLSGSPTSSEPGSSGSEDEGSGSGSGGEDASRGGKGKAGAARGAAARPVRTAASRPARGAPRQAQQAPAGEEHLHLPSPADGAMVKQEQEAAGPPCAPTQALPVKQEAPSVLPAGPAASPRPDGRGGPPGAGGVGIAGSPVGGGEAGGGRRQSMRQRQHLESLGSSSLAQELGITGLAAPAGARASPKQHGVEGVASVSPPSPSSPRAPTAAGHAAALSLAGLQDLEELGPLPMPQLPQLGLQPPPAAPRGGALLRFADGGSPGARGSASTAACGLGLVSGPASAGPRQYDVVMDSMSAHAMSAPVGTLSPAPPRPAQPQAAAQAAAARRSPGTAAGHTGHGAAAAPRHPLLSPVRGHEIAAGPDRRRSEAARRLVPSGNRADFLPQGDGIRPAAGPPGSGDFGFLDSGILGGNLDASNGSASAGFLMQQHDPRRQLGAGWAMGDLLGQGGRGGRPTTLPAHFASARMRACMLPPACLPRWADC
jgi:hypothetical protein